MDFTRPTDSTVHLTIEKLWVAAAVTILICFLFLQSVHALADKPDAKKLKNQGLYPLVIEGRKENSELDVIPFEFADDSSNPILPDAEVKKGIDNVLYDLKTIMGKSEIELSLEIPDK